MKKYFILILGIIILSSSCSQKEPSQANYQIVPLPQEVVSKEGKSFILTKDTKIVLPQNASDKDKKVIDLFAESIKAITGYTLQTSSDAATSNSIIFFITDEEMKSEAYKLLIDENKIEIQAGSTAGLLYGMQTLWKSIPADAKGDVLFSPVAIYDYPAYPHRGVMLDAARHFSDAEFVKKVIDVVAMANMNVFHWHLTDDQGWRIEIKKHPKLTEIGSTRDSTIIGRHTNTFKYEKISGFYTQEQIKEVIEYASLRNITIIPEIDIPGHMLAAMTAYPHLGCTGGPYKVGCEWGVFKDVLCAGNEDVLPFLNDIFSEVAELFPSKYIHIGGDECPKDRWEVCPKCQAKIKELKIKGTKDDPATHQLQSWIIHEVEKILNEKGKQIIGWDEILEGGIAPNATIMSWRGTEGGIYAAEKGHDVIMSPETHVYLDYYQSPNVDQEPYTFGWLIDLDKVYSFSPMPENLPEDKKKHILGAQVNVWREYMPKDWNVEHMLLPRMTAIAETVWRNEEVKNFNNYVQRLHRFSKHLDRLGYENSKYEYGIKEHIAVDTVINKVYLYLNTFDYAVNPESRIKLSDGTIMTHDPLEIDKTTTVEANLTRGDEKYAYAKHFSFNKATARPISLIDCKPHGRYIFKGVSTLVDGLEGAKETYRTGTWIGFNESDFTTVVDTELEQDISSVAFNTYVNTRGMMFHPLKVIVEVSSDNKNFKEVYSKEYPLQTEHSLPRVENIKAEFNTTKARHVRLKVINPQKAPSWHENATKPLYFLIDEVMIN